MYFSVEHPDPDSRQATWTRSEYNERKWADYLEASLSKVHEPDGTNSARASFFETHGGLHGFKKLPRAQRFEIWRAFHCGEGTNKDADGNDKCFWGGLFGLGDGLYYRVEDHDDAPGALKGRRSRRLDALV